MADQLPASFVPDAPAAAMPASFVPDAPTFQAPNEKDAQGNAVVDANTLGTLASHIGAQVNPIGLGQLLPFPQAAGGAGWDAPLQALKNIGAAHQAVAEKAKAAYERGDYVTAGRHAVDYLLPVIGPVLDTSADAMQTGHYAAGVGDAIGLALAMFGPKALADVPPGVSQAAAESKLGHAVESAVTSVTPMVKRAAPALVKHGATAVGAYFGGPGGAIVGRTVGDEMAGALTERLRAGAAEPPPVAPPVAPPLRPPPGTTGTSMQPGPMPPPRPQIAAPPAIEPPATTAAPPPVSKSPQQILNEEAIAARRAALAPPVSAPAPAAEPIVAASGKMRLTAPELQEFQRLLRRGLSLPDALTQVTAARDLAGRLGGASAAEVAATVAHRNAGTSWGPR